MPKRGQEEGRTKIISAITSDLRFFALVILVVESFLGAMALKSGSQQTPLIIAFVSVLVLIIVLVGGRRLYDSRRAYTDSLNRNESFARGLGEEIYTAFDGALKNLPDSEREEAYEML